MENLNIRSAEKSITDMPGVFGSGVHCGLKAKNKDLALIYVPQASASAGVFTKNAFPAAPVVHTKEAMTRATIKAIVANSGNANACTGSRGKEDVKKTAEQTAKWLSLGPDEIAIASTGIIGKPLDIESLLSGLEELCRDPKESAGRDAAEAILTTDTCVKEVWRECEIEGKTIAVAGMTKGSGMIAPNMATTLSFATTNVAIEPTRLQSMLRNAIDTTLNMTSVDSDTSTSDMALLIATGEHELDWANPETVKAYAALLESAFEGLALKLVRDGEGATKVIELAVTGAKSVREARLIARSVINSPLVKTAMYGQDPNWGRILMAAGKTEGVEIDPEKVSLHLGKHCIVEDGQPTNISRDKIRPSLAGETVHMHLELNLGESAAKAWGCDLTHAYVDINTAYN